MRYRWLLLLACIISFAAPRLRAAEDWPQFRGPTGQGISAAKNVPVQWDAKTHVAWKVPIPGRGWSSPALAGGKVYLTSAIGEGHAVTLHAMCLDAETGKGVWDVELFRPAPNLVRAMHPKNSPASPTPIIAGGRVYVHFGPMGTAALDLDGKVIWTQTALKYAPVHGDGGSPALVDGLLIVDCDGSADPFVAALDAKTGQIKWTTPRNTTARRTFSFCTPLAIDVGGASQVVCPGSGFVGAYDPASGRELWRVRYGEGYSVVPRPIYAHGLVYVSSGFDAPWIYAIDPKGAAGDATGSHVAWRLRKGAPTTPSLVAVGDDVYAISDIGIAVCADARTGQVYWSHRLPGGFSASPVTAENRIYYQSEDGVGYVVQAGRSFSLLASNDLGERSLASYAVTDGALFIRTERNLWKIR